MSTSEYASSPSVEFLYQDNHNWLQNWLRRRLGCAAEAADLAHDTFVRLLRSPQRFDSQPEVRAYLRVVANGLCVDLWRHREVERAWLETLAVLPEAQAPSPEDQHIVLQALREIDAMLCSLPARAARALVLSTACGMTYQEIARELGVSSRTVGTYVTQAMLHCMRLEAATLVGQGAGQA
ncbi:sigma-70 family RNA polymerase sigma factor [Pseudothauera rhizosphaerae]|uniref:Sigma-70 family RNA polymerase sigma factor n=1 Tax=Pseudothauera rhizosphaerae TaxID=2565932 RepID=A0A4S4AL00_9RHOO|nr:sigma-70 family RNA polymerase sigma factor [Pseudothauera rhizosphaerae]THF60154.1 sigma-70 family RNA polymerase sigma factor [Pseudothauera rhizosphaerae]